MNGKFQNWYNLGLAAQGLNLPRLFHYCLELEDNQALIKSIEKKVKPVKEFKTKKFAGIYDFRFYRILMYCLTRALKPGVFIETGVMHGLTSRFILEALSLNKSGKLISIDLPSYPESGPASKDGYLEVLPRGRQPGWAVSTPVRKHWQLVKGNSLSKLPSLLKKLKKIDIFLHDSDHTYHVMWSEMELVWLYLRPGGLMICDNISDTTAFFDFSKSVGREPLIFTSPDFNLHEGIQFGILIK